MKLSRKADYALRVLFTLVDRWGTGPVSMNELARRNDVPKRFLEHIMLDLKSQGWVASTPGRKGGYILAQSPERITMGQVVRFFDGVMAPIGCISVTRPVNRSSKSLTSTTMVNSRRSGSASVSVICISGIPYRRQSFGPDELGAGGGTRTPKTCVTRT